MKNLFKIYDIFKSNKEMKEADSLSDISKITKNILISKKKYRNYFLEYAKKTEVYSFKSPGITQYPLLQKKSCSLLPIKREKMEFFEDLKENKKESGKKDEISLFSKNNKFLFNTSRESFYKNKMRKNLKISKLLFKNRLLNLEKTRHLTKNNQRYNSLFLDFFHKWNKDKIEEFNCIYDEESKINNIDKISHTFANHIDDYKHIINEKYSELKYDDNLIFNSDYTPFVNDRLDFILLNNIENVETILESNFNDLNKNEIKLRLESIKIIFKPIKSKISSLNNFPSKESNPKKNIILYIPLYFAFIFCLKDVDFFKYILLSCIIFSENDKIIFDENLIKPALKALFSQKKEEKNDQNKIARNSGVINTVNKKSNKTFRRTATKAGISFRKSSVEKKGTTIGNNNSKIFNMARNSILDYTTNFKKKKKEEVIFSNKKKIIIFIIIIIMKVII